MHSFDEFNEAKDTGNKIKAITSLANALRSVFEKLDLPTRKSLWAKITSKHGEELVAKLIRNPNTTISDSEFRKLVL